MEDRSFYVYAHYRLDTMEPFYIGKGKEERANKLNRNSLHDNVSKKHGHAVVILYDNLTEEEAFFYEREVIEDLVFNEGYEIYCNNIEVTNKYSYLTNFTFGGEGTTGHNPWDNKTEEEIKEIKKKISKTVKETFDNMNEEEKEEISKKISEANKKRYEDTKNREKTSKATKIALNKPEVKEKISNAVKKRYENPKNREKQSEAIKKHYEDPKNREKLSKSIKIALNKPEVKEKLSKSIKKHYEDSKNREKQSEAIKKSWKNPERKKKQSEKLSGENNGTSKYHKVIIDNNIIIGRFLEETISISNKYLKNINRNWFKKSKGIPKKFKDRVYIEEISKEEFNELSKLDNINYYKNIDKM